MTTTTMIIHCSFSIMAAIFTLFY